MDTKKLNSEILIKLINDNDTQYSDEFNKAKEEDIRDKINNKIYDLLEERKDQRKKIFNFIYRWTFGLLIFLVVFIIVQVCFNIWIPSKELIDVTTFRIIVVSIVGQFLGAIWLITRALWDNSSYLKMLNTKDKDK